MAGENKVRPEGFKAWCENFWYHYKYFTIVAVVIIIAITVSVVQCSVKPTYDYYFVIVSDSVELAPKQIEAFEKELAVYGEDLDKNGEVNISIIDCTFNKNASSYQVIMAKKQKLTSVLMNEEEALMVISEKSCFEWINSEIGEDFLTDLDLSKEDGRYFPLDNTKPVISAKKYAGEYTKWPKELVLSRRKIEGTLIEDKDNAQKAKAAAEKYMNRLMADNKIK